MARRPLLSLEAALTLFSRLKGFAHNRRLCHEPIEFLPDPEMVQVVLCESSDLGYADVEHTSAASLAVGSIVISEFRSVQALRPLGRLEESDRSRTPQCH